METLGYVFLPFVFYPIWGIFACFFVATMVSRRVIGKYGFVVACSAATLVLLAFFTPAIVLSEGGNIPVIFPLIAVYLGYILNPFLEAPIGQVSIIDFVYVTPVAIIVSVVASIVVQRRAKKSKP